MKKLRVYKILALCCFSLACTTDEGVTDDSASTQILFVGNSLTYSNDLPKLVEKIGKKKDTPIKTHMLAYPNYALEDHWNDGEVQKLLASGRFAYVVVQQGPSSQADGRAILLDYGERMKTLCTMHNAQLAFYMVWPAKVNYHMFEGVIKNYSDAALHTNSILCPVGKVWKEHMDATQDFSYYSADLFHPSEAGSNVAAQIIYNSLFIESK